ncbi:unnamed protein product [Sphagnum balticum]
MQSGTAWPRGWFGSVANTNRQFIQDQNAIDFVFGYMIAYILQQGIPEWDGGTNYFTNGICQIAGQIFISLQDNNLNNNPSISPTWWQPGIPGAEVTGVIKSFAGLIAPAGYLACSGQAVSRTTYAALFAICGTNYGAGDGVTTFNLPNLQGKIPVGYLSGDLYFGSVGQQGGEEQHTLITNEMPAHVHELSGEVTAGSGGENAYGPGGYGGQTQSQGGGLPHNNVQPYQTIGVYIIKT